VTTNTDKHPPEHVYLVGLYVFSAFVFVLV